MALQWRLVNHSNCFVANHGGVGQCSRICNKLYCICTDCTQQWESDSEAKLAIKGHTYIGVPLMVRPSLTARLHSFSHLSAGVPRTGSLGKAMTLAGAWSRCASIVASLSSCLLMQTLSKVPIISKISLLMATPFGPGSCSKPV